MPPLFHSAPILLEPGSIVLPGNYGRIIRQVGKAHPLWARETALEDARRARYPEKPSRLDACFAFADEAVLRFFVQAMSKKRTSAGLCPVLYEVEKVTADGPEHRADFNVVEPLPRYDADMARIAELYWTSRLWITVAEAPGIRCEEVVTTSALRILRLLDQ